MENKKSQSDSRALQSEIWIDIPIENLMKKRASKNAQNMELACSRPGTGVHSTREHFVPLRKHDKVGQSEQHNSFKTGKEQLHHSSKCRSHGRKELFEAGDARSRNLEQCRSDGNVNRRTIKTKEITSDDPRQAQYLESRDIFETGGDSICNSRQSNRRNRDMIETRSRNTFEASGGRLSYDSSSSHRKKRVGLEDGSEKLQNLKATHRRNIDASGTASYSPIHSHRKNRHSLESEGGKPYNPGTNYFKNYVIEEDRLRNPRISYKNIDALQTERDQLNDHKFGDHRTRDELGTVGSKLHNPSENPRKTRHAFEGGGHQSNDFTPSPHESRVTSEANENSNASLIVSEVESGTKNFALIVGYWRRLGSWWTISHFRRQLRSASLYYFVVLIVSIICIVVAAEVSVEWLDIPLSILMVCIACSPVTLLCERGLLLKYIECKVRLSEGKPGHDDEFRPACRDFFFCCFAKNDTFVPSRRSRYARRSEINTAFEHEIADVSNIILKKCPQLRLLEETEFMNSKSPDNRHRLSKIVAAVVHLSETSEESRKNAFICEHSGQNVACGCCSQDLEEKSKFSNTSDLYGSNNEIQDGRCDKLDVKRKIEKSNTSPFQAANSQFVSTFERKKDNEYSDEINKDGEYRHVGRFKRQEETSSRYSLGDDEVFIRKDANSSSTHVPHDLAQDSKRKIDNFCSPSSMKIEDNSESKKYALDESIPKFSLDQVAKTSKTTATSNFVSRCQYCGADIRNSVDNETTFFSRTFHVCKNVSRNVVNPQLVSEKAAGENILPLSSKRDDDDDVVFICEHFGQAVACGCAETAQKKSSKSRGPSL